MTPRLIAVTGGIGSGKSVVCRILAAKGYKVYDCDSEAKRIMDSAPRIISAIGERVCHEAVRPDGTLDRKILAAAVFSDPARLAALNSIVHGAVIDDIKAWCATHTGADRLFVETAILYQSNLDRLVDEVWEVTAPEKVRVARACRRDNADANAVRARVEAQKIYVETPHPDIHYIINDDTAPVLPQVNSLLARQVRG